MEVSGRPKFKPGDSVVWLKHIGVVTKVRGTLSHEGGPNAYKAAPEVVYVVRFKYSSFEEEHGCWESDLTKAPM